MEESIDIIEAVKNILDNNLLNKIKNNKTLFLHVITYDDDYIDSYEIKNIYLEYLIITIFKKYNILNNNSLLSDRYSLKPTQYQIL